ncbi:MAG: four helix bundle protein [Verrucomicrobiia bacterium]
MAKYQRFEDVPVWQEAARLYQHVLEVLEEPNLPLTATFRNQLERAALSVGNIVAGGFEGVKAHDLVWLLADARGAAVEVQSMVAVISERPKLARLRERLQQIRASAEVCARQLGAWKYAVENPQAKRSSVPEEGAPRERPQASSSGPEFRTQPPVRRPGA